MSCGLPDSLEKEFYSEEEGQCSGRHNWDVWKEKVRSEEQEKSENRNERQLKMTIADSREKYKVMLLGHQT